MRGKSQRTPATGVEAEQPTTQRDKSSSSSSSSLALQSSSSGVKGRPDEEIVEQKLSEKLLDGFLLLEKACPCCATPLVKQEEESGDPSRGKAGRSSTPTLDADSLSTLQATVTPIAGIPFCVTCQAHIVTDEVEAVALQERYAGQTVQGKIMVAISGGQGCLPPIGTKYGDRSSPSKARKKLSTEKCDEDSVPSSPRKQPAPSPALVNKKDTIEMFRSSSSVGGRRTTPSAVPAKAKTPLMQKPPPPRHAPAIAIEQGESEEIEMICAESMCPSEDEMETTEEETEQSDEDSLRVMTSQDGPVETKEASDKEPKAKDIQEGNQATNESFSVPKIKENEADAATGANPTEERAERDEEAYTFEEVCVQAKLALEQVRSDDQATENKDDSSEQEVSVVSEQEAGEAPEGVTPHSEAADHEDVFNEISVDEEDLMVGSADDLTTEGSHSVEHDDGSWPSYEERKAVATKVLGVKIMQGYSLLEKQCAECTMPLTEYRGSIDCVVCPVLRKKSVQAKQHRSILAREMARVKLETQMMEQRKVVQANKNKLLEKTKKLGNTLNSSCVSSSASVKANGTLSDTPVRPSGEKDSDQIGNLKNAKRQSEVMATGSKSTSTSVARTTTASNVGQARLATGSIITSKALNSSGPSPVAEGSPLTSPIRSKSEESNKSKTVVKADNTLSTSNTSTSNASNQSKIVVKAQTPLSATTAGSSAVSYRSKVVVKAQSLLSAATATSTQASDKSRAIRIGSFVNKSTVPSSPSDSKCKNIAKLSSHEEEPVAVPTSGNGMGPPIDKGESTSEGVRPTESKEKSRPIRPVMALVKVTPQPDPTQSKRTKKDNDQGWHKAPSSPQGSDDSSKLSSVYSDSTISTKSKISRSTLQVAVVEHVNEAKAQPTMEEKVNMAIGPNHIRSMESDDSSEKNMSVATPMVRSNCMTTMFNAAIGTLSGEDNAISPPTQQELHRMNLEEIRLLQEAIQAGKAMHEKGIQRESEEEKGLVKENKLSPTSEPREKAKKHKHKKAMKAKGGAKVVPKPLDKTKKDAARGVQKTERTAVQATEGKATQTSAEEKKETEVLAKAIAEADKTVIAETEGIVRSFAEDYHQDQSITSSQKEIRRQQWETLRSEGRAAMTRRTMTGWTVTSEFCRGKECASSPLVIKGSAKHCVVCGGTGTGKDGVYDLSMDEDEKAGPDDSPVTTANHDDTIESTSKYLIRPPHLVSASTTPQATKASSPVKDPEKNPSSNALDKAVDVTEKEDPKTLIRPPRLDGVVQEPESDSKGNQPNHASFTKPASLDIKKPASLDIKKPEPLDLIKPPSMAACSPTEIRMLTVETQHPTLVTSPLTKTHHDIESKRAVVSKEIGKRMLKGWKLLDLSCPTCLMPLMIDENDENEVCVLCGLVTEGIQSTGTESTMQPTLSDTDSLLNSPVSFKALSPIGIDHNLMVRHLETSHTQKPDGPFAGQVHQTGAQKLTQKSPAEKSNKKSAGRSPKTEAKKDKSKDAEESRGVSSRKSPKKSKRKSSKAKSSKQSDEPSISHLAARAGPRVNAPKSDPPASRAHNVVRRSVLEADAVKAGDAEPRFDVKDTSPLATDKACGPSPSMNKVFDSDKPKKNEGPLEDPSSAVGTSKAFGPSPSIKSKAFGPSPSIKKTFDYDCTDAQVGTTKPTAIDPPMPSPNITTQLVTDAEKKQDEQHPPEQQENLTLEIPKGFDVEDEDALRNLIAQAKLRHPNAQDHVQTAEPYQNPPLLDVSDPTCLSKDGERGNCHLPSPGLITNAPASLHVQIETMGQFSEQTMDAIYHLPSPGMTEASLPLKSPASYCPRSVAPELRVHTGRSSNQMRPRIAPESMGRPRPNSKSRASGGEVSVTSSSASSYQPRLPHASPGAYSGYHIERKTPQSPEIIVIGGPMESHQEIRRKTRSITSGMDDLASYAATSVAATSAADSISTEALDALLARIEETKSHLQAAGSEEDGVEKQEKIAGLLHALSSAAAQMEMLDDRSSTSTEQVETASTQQGAPSTASTGNRARRYRDV